MKILFSALLVIASSSQLQARCVSGSVYISPQKPLNPSSCLLIKGYGNEQKIIDGLNKDYPIYLESENKQRVDLQVKFSNKGQYRINQAILQPEQPLVKGEMYALKVDNLIETKENGNPKYFWNPDKTPIRWKVEAASQPQPLARLLSEPRLVDKSTVHYGCGPSVSADFEFITDIDTGYLIETELVNIESGKSTLYYLDPPKDGLLSIGHGMCSGAFKFTKDLKYKIRFNIINDCNNAEVKWTKWIEFDSPYESFSYPKKSQKQQKKDSDKT